MLLSYRSFTSSLGTAVLDPEDVAYLQGLGVVVGDGVVTFPADPVPDGPLAGRWTDPAGALHAMGPDGEGTVRRWPGGAISPYADVHVGTRDEACLVVCTRPEVIPLTPAP